MDGPLGISVSGTGRVSVAAEVATLRVGVAVENASLDDARSIVAKKSTAALDHLVLAGVDPAMITTASLSVRNHHDRRHGRQLYHVSTEMVVVLTDLTTADTLVDELFSVIGDGMQLRGLNYSTRDPNAGREQATELAFADAKAKADQLARLAGVGLGEVVAVSESGGSMFHEAPPVMRGAAMAAEATIPIEPGQLDQEVTVQVRWTIQ